MCCINSNVLTLFSSVKCTVKRVFVQQSSTDHTEDTLTTTFVVPSSSFLRESNISPFPLVYAFALFSPSTHKYSSSFSRVEFTMPSEPTSPTSIPSGGGIGIANLPNQLHKIVTKKGTNFSVMVVGKYIFIRIRATRTALVEPR